MRRLGVVEHLRGLRDQRAGGDALLERSRPADEAGSLALRIVWHQQAGVGRGQRQAGQWVDRLDHPFHRRRALRQIDAGRDTQHEAEGGGEVDILGECGLPGRNVDGDAADLDRAKLEGGWVQAGVELGDDGYLIDVAAGTRVVLEIDRIRQLGVAGQEAVGLIGLWPGQRHRCGDGAGIAEIAAEVQRGERIGGVRRRAVDLVVRRQAGTTIFERDPRHVDVERLEIRRCGQVEIVFAQRLQRRDRGADFIRAPGGNGGTGGRRHDRHVAAVQRDQIVEEAQQIAGGTDICAGGPIEDAAGEHRHQALNILLGADSGHAVGGLQNAGRFEGGELQIDEAGGIGDQRQQRCRRRIGGAFGGDDVGAQAERLVGHVGDEFGGRHRRRCRKDAEAERDVRDDVGTRNGGVVVVIANEVDLAENALQLRVAVRDQGDECRPPGGQTGRAVGQQWRQAGREAVGGGCEGGEGARIQRFQPRIGLHIDGKAGRRSGGGVEQEARGGQLAIGVGDPSDGGIRHVGVGRGGQIARLS